MKLLALCVAMLCLLIVPKARAETIEGGIVRVHISKKEVDKGAPWQFEEVSQQSYLGVIMPGPTVLTTAYAVADAAFIELQRFGSSRRAEAEVVFVDYEANLALLKPVLSTALAGARPVTLGDDLAIDESLEIYKMRDSYQVSRLPASLQDVGIFSAVTSNYSLASYLLKVQQSGLGWAEPVFRQGKLVAITTGQDANFVHALPSSMIKHFMDDRLGGVYRGFPSIGVQLQPLVSPEMRRQIGAQNLDAGVRVAEIQKGSSFAKKLLPNDVILAIDGQEISEHGFFTHPKWGKVHLKYLINQHFGGDQIKLKILRQGQEMTVEGVLERFDSNRSPVVAYRYGQAEPHVIFGGLVFQELSQDFLKQWGKEWKDIAPLELLFALNFQSKPTDEPTEKVIIVSRVLADEFNRGYGDIRFQIVDQVNGVRIQSLAALKQALTAPIVKNGKLYARVVFRLGGGEAILGYEGLNTAHQRIAKTYEIKKPESFFNWGEASGGQ